MKSYERQKFKKFIPLCKSNGIDTNFNKFFTFCNHVVYYDAEDSLFYQYAPMELRHRTKYDIKHLFKRFNQWNEGRKFYYVWNKSDGYYYDTIEASNSNKAKYKYAKDNFENYTDIRHKLHYEYCL